MDAASLRRYLGALCDDLDQGLPLGRTLGLTALAGLALVETSCAEKHVETAVGLYGAPQPTAEYVSPPPRVVTVNPTPAPAEKCDDGIDNNGDGKIDCADPLCQDEQPCTGPVDLYAAP